MTDRKAEADDLVDAIVDVLSQRNAKPLEALAALLAVAGAIMRRNEYSKAFVRAAINVIWDEERLH